MSLSGLARILLLCCAVVVAACSNGATGGSTAADGDVDVADLVSAFGDFFAELPAESRAYFGSEAASADVQRCVGRSFAEGLVDSVGVDALAAAGVTAEGMRSGEADLASVVSNSEFDVLLLDAYDTCVDLVELVVRDDAEGPEADAFRCLLEELLDDEAGREALAYALFTVGEASAITDALGSVYLESYAHCLG